MSAARRARWLAVLLAGVLAAGIAGAAEDAAAPRAMAPAPADHPPPDKSDETCTGARADACAQTPNKIRSWSIENDAWGRIFHPTDRNYTMGVPVTEIVHGEPSGTVWRALWSVAHGWDELLGQKPDPRFEEVSQWGWGNSTFTPKNLRTADPIPDDRPYASLLYVAGGYSTNTAFLSEHLPATWPMLARTTVFELGVLGTNVSRDVQTAIHRRCCVDDIPKGWDNQIGQGGSPTFLLSEALSLQTPMVESAYGRTAGRASLGAECGYECGLFANATLAIGSTLNDVTYAMSSTAPQVTNPVSLKAWGLRSPDDRAFGYSAPAQGLGAYLTVEGRLLAYNELLQGAWTGSNRVTIPFGQARHAIGSATLGIDLSFATRIVCSAWRYAVSGAVDPAACAPHVHYYLVQGWHSRDMRNASEGSHYWGGIKFTFDVD